MDAKEILDSGIDAIGNRSKERDTGAERSMTRTVAAFNALYDKDLTVVEGWQFMSILKKARAQGGNLRLDDYIDDAAYAALAGEAAQETGANG